MPGVLSTEIRIFDFDLTLNNVHSFEFNSLGVESVNESPEYHYQEGVEEAQHTAKTNVPLLHDESHISAIASHHNNPMFIAGFVAQMLGKKLTYNETYFPEDNTNIAVDVFSVEGTDRPFLITYITAIDLLFNTIKNSINQKNDQINLLTSVLLEKKQITKNARIDFYDDAELNVDFAKQLPGIVPHKVQPDATRFTLQSSDDNSETMSIAQHRSQKMRRFVNCPNDELVFRFYYDKPLKDKAQDEMGFILLDKGRVKSEELFQSRETAKILSHGLKEKLGLEETDSTMKTFPSNEVKGCFRVVLTREAVEKIKQALIVKDNAPKLQSPVNELTTQQYDHFKKQLETGESARSNKYKQAKNANEIKKDDLESLHWYWEKAALIPLRNFIKEKCGEDPINFKISILPHPDFFDYFNVKLTNSWREIAVVEVSLQQIITAINDLDDFEVFERSSHSITMSDDNSQPLVKPANNPHSHFNRQQSAINKSEVETKEKESKYKDAKKASDILQKDLANLRFSWEKVALIPIHNLIKEKSGLVCTKNCTQSITPHPTLKDYFKITLTSSANKVIAVVDVPMEMVIEAINDLDDFEEFENKRMNASVKQANNPHTHFSKPRKNSAASIDNPLRDYLVNSIKAESGVELDMTLYSISFKAHPDYKDYFIATLESEETKQTFQVDVHLDMLIIDERDHPHIPIRLSHRRS